MRVYNSFPCTDPSSSAPLLHTPLTINSTAVSLSWDEVNCTDRNGVITGYIVHYTVTEGMTVTVNISVTTSVVIAGLIKFRLYSFNVAAMDLIVMDRSFIQVCTMHDFTNVSLHHDGLLTTIVETIVHGLSAFSTTSGIILVWDPLTPDVFNATYEYEVAYNVDPDCSAEDDSLPNGYTLYYPRTSNHYIEVVGLMSGTCFVFGVRTYTSVTDSLGEFSLIQGNTISEGYIIILLSIN